LFPASTCPSQNKTFVDLEVKASTLGPSAGVGVFARQKIGRNTLLTEYGVDVVRQLFLKKVAERGKGQRGGMGDGRMNPLMQAAHMLLRCVCVNPG
jgi:hypothetical protein